MGTVTPVGARHRGLTPTPRPAPHSPGGGAIPPLTDEERGGTCGGIWQQPHAPADRTPPAWGPESGARWGRPCCPEEALWGRPLGSQALGGEVPLPWKKLPSCFPAAAHQRGILVSNVIIWD